MCKYVLVCMHYIIIPEWRQLCPTKPKFISVDLTVTLVISTLLLFSPALPSVSYFFPCHQFSSSIISIIYPGSCSSLLFYWITYVLELIVLIPTLLIGGFQTILLAVAISTLNKHIASIRYVFFAPYCER